MVREVVREQLQEGVRTMATYEALGLDIPFESFARMLQVGGTDWGKWQIVRLLEGISPEEQQAIKQIKDKMLELSQQMASIVKSGDKRQA